MKVPRNELHFPGNSTGRVSGDDVYKLVGTVSSVTTTATPATGTCGVQFVFKDSKGVALAAKAGVLAYISTSTGDQSAAITSLAALTNGTLTQLVTGKVALCTITAAGLLGITLTGNAGTYYLTFVNEANGSLLTSSALTIN